MCARACEALSIVRRQSRMDFPISNRCESIGDSPLLWQSQRGSTEFGELSRSGEMIGVNMGIENVGDFPARAACQVEVDFWCHRSIDHCSLISAPDEIGKAPLARPAYLNDAHQTVSKLSSAEFQARLQAFIPPMRVKA